MTTNATIADYRLVRSLGSGGQGEVHAAVPPARLGLSVAEVAVKVFTPFVDDAGFDRAAAELAAHVGLGSAHLLAVHDIGLQESTLYVCTELAAGHAAPVLDAAAALAAVASAASGLHDLHEGGVVHGGVKPTNLLRTGVGVVMSEPNLADVIAPGQTGTGVGPQGGLQYLDPTTLTGDVAGRASDVWALGVTLHELLTGEGVHPSLDLSNTMGALRTLIDTPPVVAGSIDAPIADLIRACVSLDRSQRPATALDVVGRIEAIGGR